MSATSSASQFANPSKAAFGSLQAAGLILDLAYQGIDAKDWDSLFAKATEIKLNDQIKALLGGELVNTSEQRPALHTALRNLDKKPVLLNGQDLMPEIAEVWQRIDGLCNKWVGVTDLIHIGIGGSDFGPRLAVQALAHSATKSNRSMRIHFAANVDSAELSHILERAQPNSTKVLIVSKSFGTTENLWNNHIFDDIKEFRDKKILEIAPGYGRITQFLSILASELLVVDLNDNCIKKTK